jgi:uncharacterized protein (DUF342 family)
MSLIHVHSSDYESFKEVVGRMANPVIFVRTVSDTDFRIMARSEGGKMGGTLVDRNVPVAPEMQAEIDELEALPQLTAKQRARLISLLKKMAPKGKSRRISTGASFETPVCVAVTLSSEPRTMDTDFPNVFIRGTGAIQLDQPCTI